MVWKMQTRLKKESIPCGTKIKKKPMNQINLQQSPQRSLATCNNKRDIQGGKKWNIQKLNQSVHNFSLVSWFSRMFL